jgi:hypothetical protein
VGNRGVNMVDFEKLITYPYKVVDNCLCMVYMKSGEEEFKKLCNFVPYITSDVAIDTGNEIERKIRLRGVHQNGEMLREIDIMAAELTSTSMSWIIENWGAKCNVEARNVKDNIRHAIQCTVEFASSTNIFQQFGWKKINEEWQFLIKGNEIETCASGKLANYYLSDCDRDTSLKVAFDLLNSKVVSSNIIYPLMALAFLSPLNSFLKTMGYEPKFVMCLIGKTGTKKSTISALILSFFGDFSNTDLPFSFRDTENSILSSAFLLKDMLTVIDDFHPSSNGDGRKMNGTAQTIMRGFGDRVGRGRLNSDSTPMSKRYPTGNVIITGEQPPDVTQSGLARCLILEIEKDDVDLAELTYFQNKAKEGLLSSAMKQYIAYIKDCCLVHDEQAFLDKLTSLFSKYRNEFANKLREECIEYHDRLPEMGSWLMIGLLFALKLLRTHNVISEQEYDYERIKTFDVFYQVIKSQAKTVQEDKPSEIFVSKLRALFESGRATTIDKSSEFDNKSIEFVGYHDEDYYYLISDIAYGMVQMLSREQGVVFPVAIKTLLKHLSDDGYIEKNSSGGNTHVLRVNDKFVRVIKMIRK